MPVKENTVSKISLEFPGKSMLHSGCSPLDVRVIKVFHHCNFMHLWKMCNLLLQGLIHFLYLVMQIIVDINNNIELLFPLSLVLIWMLCTVLSDLFIWLSEHEWMFLTLSITFPFFCFRFLWTNVFFNYYIVITVTTFLLLNRIWLCFIYFFYFNH